MLLWGSDMSCTITRWPSSSIVMNSDFPLHAYVVAAVFEAAIAKCEFSAVYLRLRELCVKLMFLHPVDYGRKAEELLWRKVYYEVIQLIKTNKKAGIWLWHEKVSGCVMGETELKASFAWRSCGLNRGAGSQALLKCTYWPDICFLSSCGQVSFNDLLRELPLQRIFQHNMLNFCLPIFKGHVSPCRMMVLRGFDCFY